MINEKDLQNYVNKAEINNQKKEYKNLEKRMKKDVMRAISDFDMIKE